MTSLRQRTISGLGWQGATQISIQMLQFVTSVAIARLLGPREFGLVGMVMVFAGFASIFSDMGLGAAVIQRRELSERHLNSVFWINVGAGLLLTVLFLAVAPLIAQFYEQPALRSLTAILSLTFIPGALSVVQDSLINKSLNFRARFWIETVAILVSGTVAVCMALAGAGVWSLAGQTLSAAATRSFVSWRMSAWRPAWSFDAAALKELFGFSRNMLGNSIFTYWGKNTDRLLLGRFVGSTDLGVYSFAFRLVSLPQEVSTGITNAVMFPVMSVIQEDHQVLRRVYLRSTRMIALVTFPILTGLAVLAEPATVTVYGDRWRAGITIVQILAFSGMAQSVFNTATWLFLSQNRTDIVFRIGVYATLVRIIGVLAGIHWGIHGVAWAYLAGTYVFLWYPVWRTAGRLVNLQFHQLLRNLAGPFFCTAGMGAVIWICDRWIFEHFAPWQRLSLGVPLGILTYGFLVHRSQLEAWNELRAALLGLGGETFPALRWVLGEKPPAGSDGIEPDR